MLRSWKSPVTVSLPQLSHHWANWWHCWVFSFVLESFPVWSPLFLPSPHQESHILTSILILLSHFLKRTNDTRQNVLNLLLSTHQMICICANSSTVLLIQWRKSLLFPVTSKRHCSVFRGTDYEARLLVFKSCVGLSWTTWLRLRSQLSHQ